jgi:hypothetical protein
MERLSDMMDKPWMDEPVPEHVDRPSGPLFRRVQPLGVALGWVARPTLSLGLAIGLAACGGETEPTAGDQAVASTTTTTAPTTTTEPPVTTTTINFDREPTQDDAPLPENSTAEELFDVVNDMRGATRDASEQIERLATFLDLASPERSQILDFSIAVEPVEDDRFDISTQVRLRAPQPTAELATFYDGELRSAGWIKAAFSETTTDGLPGTELIYRVPGTSGADTELSITLTQGQFSVIDLDFKFLSEEDDPSFEQLVAWQSDIRTPRSATLAKTVVFTTEDTASLQVIYALEADTAAEAREDIEDLVRDDEFTIESATVSGTTVAPLLLVDEDGQEYLLDFAPTRNPELFWMMVSATAELVPVPDD